VIFGVTFMVAFIFLFIVSTEKLIAAVVSRYNRRFSPRDEDAEADPASLVGTFKRYKN